MKIGVSLVGISHLDSEKENRRDMVGRIGRNRKFDHMPPNIIDNIVNPLRESNDVSIYLTTYDHTKINELISLYQPKNTQLLNYDDHYMQKTYAKSLLNLTDDNNFIISTRFDIVFKKTYRELNIDYTKFNVLFKEKGHSHVNYTCDNFYAFPSKYARIFSESIDSLYQSGERNGLHGAVHQLSKVIGYNNINFISDIDQLGGDNEFYYLPHRV